MTPSSDRGLIFDIKRFSINDGPGIRTTIFFKGCPLSCWWCHNPEGLSAEIEEVRVMEKLDGKEFWQIKKVGTFVTVEDLMEEIEKEKIFHETSGGGVTFSGGEPLNQHKFLLRLADECTRRGIHTCLDTSGYVNPGIFRSVLNRFDLFLYDIKMLDNRKHKHYTGVSPEMITENLLELSKSDGKFIIRFPVIPGINDDEENISQMTGFLKNLDNKVKEIHLLPYHASAKSKYNKFGREFKIKNTINVDENKLDRLKDEFVQIGYRVKIGG
jgi:pyruvate formate lyase activating enzyme